MDLYFHAQKAKGVAMAYKDILSNSIKTFEDLGKWLIGLWIFILAGCVFTVDCVNGFFWGKYNHD